LQKYGVPQTYSNIISPFLNPGGWLGWGVYNQLHNLRNSAGKLGWGTYNYLRKAFTPSKPNDNSLRVASSAVTPNPAPEALTVMADPVQEAPFPEIIYGHTTYHPFIREWFKDKAGVQLQNRRFQVYGDF
jgi:hypothetical protein